MNRWVSGMRDIGRSIFVLTTDERKALCLILALALLGLSVKAWHMHHAPPPAAAVGK